MDKFVDYKEVPFGDKVGWDVEYEPICGGRGNTKIVGGFYYVKPVEKRGLYDLYVDNHIDIPDTISKDSPCYKQFMKEKENVE